MISVWKGSLALAVYVGAIVAANVLTQHFGMVPVGFGLLVTAGTYAAGFALLARDFVQRYAGVWWTLAGIAVGIVLSWFLASPALAVASAVAFAVAELADLAVYSAIRPRGFVIAALVSGIVAAPIDTVLFLWIAGFPLTWETLIGQLVGKIIWATIVPLLLYVIGRRCVTSRIRRVRRSEIA